MTKILNLISSAKGAESVTIKLAIAIINKIKASESNVIVKERNLAINSYPHLEGDEITSIFTPAEYRTLEQQTILKKSDEAVAELFEADIIIIGAPMYNFTIPSSLKAYFDRITRAGVTFNYTDKGPEGLLKNKKVYIAAASGSMITEEHMQKYDFVTPYVKTLLGFLGVTDVTVFRAEGLSIPELKETALNKAIDSIKL